MVAAQQQVAWHLSYGGLREIDRRLTLAHVKSISVDLDMAALEQLLIWLFW